MNGTHDPHDLLLLALGRLEGPAAEAARAAIARSPSVAAEMDRIREHLRLYDALPPVPAPPPFERVLAALPAQQDGRGLPPGRARRVHRLAAAAGVLLLVGGLVAGLALLRGDPTPGPAAAPVAVARGTWERPSPGRFLLAGQDPGQVDVRWPAAPGGIVRLPERRARLVAAPGTRLGLGTGPEGTPHIDMDDGRLWIDVPPRPGATREIHVRTPGGTVRVVGTRFEVVYDAATGLAVRVARGAVAIGGEVLDSGARWPPDPVAGGASGSLSARHAGWPEWLPVPDMALVPATGPAGTETVQLEVRGHVAVDLDLPPLGGEGDGAWIEWVDPSGAVLRSVPVRGANVVDGPLEWLEGRAQLLPAGGSLRLTLRFSRPPGLPPAYRLRALLRPAGIAPWLSPALDLETPR